MYNNINTFLKYFDLIKNIVVLLMNCNINTLHKYFDFVETYIENIYYCGMSPLLIEKE